jgi:hypothetical protein
MNLGACPGPGSCSPSTPDRPIDKCADTDSGCRATAGPFSTIWSRLIGVPVASSRTDGSRTSPALMLSAGIPRSRKSWMLRSNTSSTSADADVVWLASSTLASVQGGLVLAQSRRDPLALRRALDGALALIGNYRAID